MKNYLVIGNPIEHSLSPKLHNYWIKKNNLDAIYEKKKLEENELKNVIRMMKEKKIYGLNVTVPYKKTIISYLDDLSLEAQKTQSVNTVFFKEDKIMGHNTDIVGFELAIKDMKINLVNKKILILGAGGVVSSIIFALNKMNIFDISLSNRTKSKAENLKILFPDIKVIEWGKTIDFDMIINATSLGLNKDDFIDLDILKNKTNKFFYDIIYNPKETNFLRAAKEKGNQIENGKRMFIYQALEAFKIWHGIDPKINGKEIELLD